MPLSSLLNRLYSAFGAERHSTEGQPSIHLKRLCLFFGTGRCGTSLMAQYFGGVADNRTQWRRSGKDLITHEPFDGLSVYWKMIAAAKRGMETRFVEQILLPEVELQGGCRNCLITDNKLGRWFFPEVLLAGLDARIVYLHRSPEDVIPSLRKSTASHETLHWCYQSTDLNAIASERDPHLFHVKETEEQWKRLRDQLAPEQYLEVSFERFLADRSHRAEVEKFLGMEGKENLLGRKTNATENNYKI